MATRRKTVGEAKRVRLKKSAVGRQLAARDRAKSISGLTDRRDDPDRIKKKADRLEHGRRRVTDQAKTIKKPAAAGSKATSKAKRGRR